MIVKMSTFHSSVILGVMNNSTADPMPNVFDLVRNSAGFTTTKWLDIVQFSLFAVIFVVSTCGNILVCLVVALTARMRTTHNYLLVNLAVADLTIALWCIPFDVVIKIKSPKWPLGEVMCKLLWPSMTLVTNCSAATLAFISYDRYRAVVRPMKPRFTTRQTGLLVVLIWIISLFLVLPYVLALKEEDNTCFEAWRSETLKEMYTIGLFVFQYALPLTIIAVAYYRVVLRLRRQATKMTRNYAIMMKQPPSTLLQDNWTLGTGLVKKGSDNESVASPLSGRAPSLVNAGQVTRETCLLQHPQGKHLTENDYLTTQKENKLSHDSPLTAIRSPTRSKRKELFVALNDQERQKEARRLEHNTKIIKMLLSVVLSYTLCLLPNQVAWLWCEFGDGRRWRHMKELLIFGSIMVYVNSSVNPLLYAGMNADFRKEFGRILRCHWIERPPQQVKK